jgi:hypothetical protein
MDLLKLNALNKCDVCVANRVASESYVLKTAQECEQNFWVCCLVYFKVFSFDNPIVVLFLLLTALQILETPKTVPNSMFYVIFLFGWLRYYIVCMLVG